MIKIRCYQQIVDDEDLPEDRHIISKDGKKYVLVYAKKCADDLSPFEAFQRFAPSSFLQDGSLFTVERENGHGHIEAYCYVAGVLVVTSDVCKHHGRPSNGVPNDRARSRQKKEIEPPPKERIRPVEDKKATETDPYQTTEDFLLYVREHIHSYSTVETLHQRQDDVKTREERKKEQRKDQPEQDKPDQSKDDECR